MVDTATRALIAPLISSKPVDALAWYFALEHDARRTRIVARTDAGGHAVAFVAVCQTGIDLFRPMVVVRSEDSSALCDALREALSPNRQYLFSAPVTLRPDIERVAYLYGETTNHIYALHQADYKPVVNIMVQASRTPDGLLRASISARDGSTAAEAGTTWISSRYAEVYVRVVEALRSRGLGRSVVSAVTNQILELGRTPIYSASDDNLPSQHVAQALGYHDTEGWELSGALGLK